MKLMLTLALLVSTAASAQDVVKVFQDKGNFFVKVDKKKPLAVGAELGMATDAEGTKAAGSAIVMEITGALARITLDDEATKANARYAKLPSAEAKAEAKPAAAAPVAAKPAEPKLPALKGRIENGLRVGVVNESDVDWTDCELRYDDGRYFQLGSLSAHSDDAVMPFKFSKPPAPPEPLYDHVLVSCDEGETKFLFDNLRSPGALKGYVENLGGGRIIVHNSGDSDWHRCDVRKPDKTHYVMEKLKARDQESIRSGNFIKEKEAEKPSATQLALRCKQGELILSLK